MGLEKLNYKFQDENLKEYFEGIFCRDHPKNTRFCINFFTSIGLGALTEELREYFQNAQKLVQNQQMLMEAEEESSSSSSSSSSSDSSDSESSAKEKGKKSGKITAK